MRKHFLLIFSLLLPGLLLLAGPLEKGFEALQVFNYFDAKEYFDKARKNRPAGACYGLSVIFHRNDNPFSNIDSAYKYILLAEKNFNSSEPKEKTSLAGLGVDATTIDRVKETVCAQAFERAGKENTIEGYDRFIKEFPHPTLKKEAAKLRNRIAFEQAKKANTAQAYKDFLTRYPDAEDAKEAKWLYEVSLFNTLTGPNTLETYENFVKQYPKSPYRTQAEDSIFSFLTPHGTLEEYNAFRKKHPGNRNVKKAWDMIYRLATQGVDPSAYANFLFDYPDFPDKARVKADRELSRMLFFLIQQDRKWGFADSAGKVRIPCTYDWADDFSEGLSAVLLHEKAGYINKAGNTIIPLAYDESNSFHGGFAIVKKNNKFGLVYKGGREILPADFEDISYDESPEGEKIFRALKEGVFKYFDAKGALLAEVKFEKTGDFFSGRAYIIQAGKYGFINRKGEMVIPPSYDWAENFRSGLARVKQGERSGLIDTTGKVILPCEYDNIDNFSEDLALVVKSKKCGFVNRAGEVVIPIKYDYSPEISAANGFLTGLAKVEINKKRGLIDKTGKPVIPCEYDDIRNFSQDLCAAKKGKWGFIDRTKKTKINFTFDYAWDFLEGFARVKVKGKIGFINLKGDLVIPATYDEASDMKNGNSIVVTAGKKGVLDKTGKLILPCEMDEISEAGKGMLKLEKNDKFAYFNLLLMKQVWAEAGF